MGIEKAMEKFVRQIEQRHLCVEGVAIADEKTVITEHRFAMDIPRNLYSNTKSFTSTAVGIAVTEGKLMVSDRLASYFPEYVPKSAQPWLGEIRLRDLLTMSSGFGYAFLMDDTRRKGEGLPDYVEYMMRQRVQNEPGKKFVYSNGDTILAGRMVEKATGMRLGGYLHQKLFGPMGIGWPVWEHDVLGHTVGASGLHLTLRDMIKLGQLYLSDGMWAGRRILTHDWVAQATTKHINTALASIDQSCGYGYQFWMNPFPGSYRAEGACGQITAVLPKQGYVVGIQCSEKIDFDKLRTLVYNDFLPELIGN